MDSKGIKDWDSLMGEIEAIKDRVEHVLETSNENSVEASSEALHEPPANAQPEYASMDEMLGGMGREEIEADLNKNLGDEPSPQESPKVVKLHEKTTQPKVSSVTRSAEESGMTLSVVGGLKLRLELTGGAQSVQIQLDEGQLTVALSDGSEFRIPLNKAA
jgi:hypothetical protein